MPVHYHICTMKQPIKSPTECREEIIAILTPALQEKRITQAEYNTALNLTTWDDLQPILDKAQGMSTSAVESLESLKQARLERPIDQSLFTPDDFEKLKTLAPDEYEMMELPVCSSYGGNYLPRYRAAIGCST